MTYLVELPVGGGDGPSGSVKVEIEPVDGGLVDVARPGQVVARASRSLSEALNHIRPLAQDFVEGFRGMPHAPEEIAIEFGLSLSAEADVVVCRSAGEANFKVSLTWRRSAAEGPGTAGPAPAPAAAGA